MPSKFDKIYEEVIGILHTRIPEKLSYHSSGHTLYVLEKAIYIAGKTGVSKKELFLIKLAALYHDIGFINGIENHEKESCKIAKKSLSKFGISKKDIDKILGMIMATQIPQSPKTVLEKIVADADLEYLATSNFKPFADLLFQEKKHQEKKLTRSKWNKIQIAFIKTHHYHTDYCKRYKEFRKIRNLEML